MTIAYAATAAVALLLLVGYLAAVHPKDKWMLLLFICIPLVNVGYLLLSMAETAKHLSFAVAANTLVYLGSVFLTPCLYMTVRHLCGEKRRPWLKWGVVGLALVMFAVIATTPWTGLYYRSLRRQRFPSQKQAVLITAIVFGNIAFWLVEQVIPGTFEFMAAFYLFSEGMLLGMHWLAQDTVTATPATPMEVLLARLPKGVSLHPREQEILELILVNEKRKEIAAKLTLSENTVKTYTRNLYRKLGVSSREELYALLP